MWKFKLQGNFENVIRSDAEMELLDKETADKAFKTHKKQLDAFLKEQGFTKYKSNAYVRRNACDVLEYIDLQKEQYGSKTMTLNYALIPLYVPHVFLSFDLGGRLGELICSKDIWWDYANDDIAAISFKNISDAIDAFLLPWFEQKASEDSIKKELLLIQKRRAKKGLKLSSVQQDWLRLIDSDEDRSDTISRNVEIFKLPSKLR